MQLLPALAFLSTPLTHFDLRVVEAPLALDRRKTDSGRSFVDALVLGDEDTAILHRGEYVAPVGDHLPSRLLLGLPPRLDGGALLLHLGR